MERDSSNEHDNALKRTSRELIANKANEHFSKFGIIERAVILELLGAGHGYEFYKENFKFAKSMSFQLIESKMEHCLNFLDTQPRDTWDSLEIYRMNLHKYFRKHVDCEEFNLINLDFCSYFTETKYKTPSVYSSLDVIRKMFESKCLKKNGLFFTTFQVEGFQIDLNKTLHDIETDADTIHNRIISIAAEYGLNIKLMHNFSYKSGTGRGSNMMNSGFTLL